MEQHVPTENLRPSNPRGFAAMDPALQREIASKGGKAAHRKGTAHEFTKEEAARAGRKGGEARAQNLMAAMKRETPAIADDSAAHSLTSETRSSSLSESIL